MALQAGIVGLPNVGKSTLFNALTAAGAESANYPFCTIEPNTGIVPVPDPRLDKLNGVINTQQVIPASVEIVDIAGLVRGASQGEGLGNQFLGHIRSVDAVLHVVRCFADPDVVHVDGSVDPDRDIDTIDSLPFRISFNSSSLTSWSRHLQLPHLPEHHPIRPQTSAPARALCQDGKERRQRRQAPPRRGREAGSDPRGRTAGTLWRVDRRRAREREGCSAHHGQARALRVQRGRGRARRKLSVRRCCKSPRRG